MTTCFNRALLPPPRPHVLTPLCTQSDRVWSDGNATPSQGPHRSLCLCLPFLSGRSLGYLWETRLLAGRLEIEKSGVSTQSAAFVVGASDLTMNSSWLIILRARLPVAFIPTPRRRRSAPQPLSSCTCLFSCDSQRAGAGNPVRKQPVREAEGKEEGV